MTSSSTSLESDSPSDALPRQGLTDFLDLDTLQELQDGFTAVTRLHTIIRDANGQAVTTPTDARKREASDLVLDQLITGDSDLDGEAFMAPILVEGVELGSIVVERQPGFETARETVREELADLARQLGVSPDHARSLIGAAEDAFGPSRAASIQLLYLMANAIARLCYEEHHARRRLDELSVLYKVSTALSVHRDLQHILDTAARSVAEAMHVKAASIRLLREKDGQQQGDELAPRAVYQLSEAYLNKGAVKVSDSSMFQDAIKGRVVYVADMATDPRVVYPSDAQREGLVSMLGCGIIHQGKPIGTVQLFTGEPYQFTHFETRLLQAIAQLLGAAIENTRLDRQRNESQRVLRQLHLAADVQRRMLPGRMPKIAPFEVAARYVPSMELAGDFYDFVHLESNLGLVVGDVVGKGVAASLLMASVRASLRAYAQDVYDLDEVISRVNIALTRDTRDNEFATLWYGVLDPAAMRLTYCNAGHDPPLLVRNGRVHQLETGGMIVGIDPHQHYDKGLFDLQPGDMLLLYTDGLVDSFNPEGDKFGRHRLEAAARSAAGRSAADALNHILWELRRFTGLRRNDDDTTLVVVRVGPGEGGEADDDGGDEAGDDVGDDAEPKSDPA